jgi:D-alanine-D-alanine ligase
MEKKQVLLVYGGRSAEHEVSVKSARNILNALLANSFPVKIVHIAKDGAWHLVPSIVENPEAHPVVWFGTFNKKAHLINATTQEKIQIDVAFPAMHGTFGEDGCIQGLFKMLSLPFVGCGVMASALGMDKEFMKRVLKEAGLPVGNFSVLHRGELNDYSSLVKNLGSPFFIKPANAGSSVGVHKVKNETDFTEKLKDAFLFDSKVLAEEFISGREVECSVLGLNRNPKASLPGEVMPTHDFYSYEAKYLDDNGAQFSIPANLPKELEEKARKLSLETFKTLGCDGLARVDFFLKSNGDFLINEINTLPGFTSISMYPKMWEATGLTANKLIHELIELALTKNQQDESNLLDFSAQK